MAEGVSLIKLRCSFTTFQTNARVRHTSGSPSLLGWRGGLITAFIWAMDVTMVVTQHTPDTVFDGTHICSFLFFFAPFLLRSNVCDGTKLGFLLMAKKLLIPYGGIAARNIGQIGLKWAPGTIAFNVYEFRGRVCKYNTLLPISATLQMW